MHKRGISPLVATVLLVGFTIAIAVLVFLFLRGQVQDLTAKFTIPVCLKIWIIPPLLTGGIPLLSGSSA